MPVQEQYLAYVLEQLARLGSLRSNRMFGGIGLYSREMFFGLIDDDTLFFKTDEENITPYRERNMPRFMPFPDRPDAVLGYHQVPADVIEDAEQLVDWARKSVEVALRRQVAKATKIRKPVKKKVAKKAVKKPAKKKAAKRAPKKTARKPARRKK
jgi:DNA transformation protein and related proteins